MLRVHKIKLNPNKAQEHYFAQACGVASTQLPKYIR
ncbi:helix-turn-helix domain-containing protein [Methylicorpusculum sp.]